MTEPEREKTDKNDNQVDAWDSLPAHLKSDTVIAFFRELSLVARHTRSLVLVTHGFIELLVNALIDHHLKNGKKITSDNRTYPHSAKLVILNELGLLNNTEYRSFDWFRKLRNRAAHEPIFSVTQQDLQVIEDPDYRDPKNFYGLCIMFVGGFWNKHLAVFGPIFAPGTFGHSKK